MVANGICAVALAQHQRVYHIADGFAHLLTIKGDPAVYCQVFGQRQIQRHQHGGPNNGVEAHNIFSHHVHIGGPIAVKVVILVIQVAQGADVVGERVYPHINHMTRVKGDGNAPSEGSAGHAQIFQTGLDKVVDQLYRAALRL